MALVVSCPQDGSIERFLGGASYLYKRKDGRTQFLKVKGGETRSKPVTLLPSELITSENSIERKGCVGIPSVMERLSCRIENIQH